jgi:hypothetical protein
MAGSGAAVGGLNKLLHSVDEERIHMRTPRLNTVIEGTILNLYKEKNWFLKVLLLSNSSRTGTLRGRDRAGAGDGAGRERVGLCTRLIQLRPIA